MWRGELRFDFSASSATPVLTSPPPAAAPLPCYFNTGGCSFRNGHVTGIEITEGEIRLVRWRDDLGQPRAQVLASAPLRQVLADSGAQSAPARLRQPALVLPDGGAARS